jgi:hypothetical protein
MLVTVSTFTFAIVWAIAATIFYSIRFKLGRRSHYWLIPAVFSLNLVFFGWSIIAVSIILAYDLYHYEKNKQLD